MLFDCVVVLCEDFVEEGMVSDNIGRFGEKVGSVWRGIDDEIVVVEGGGVFGELGGDSGFLGRREEVGEGVVGRVGYGCYW